MTSDVNSNDVPVEEDPFEGKSPVEGLEHLGKAIIDDNGIPSGSPANYEVTRGASSSTPLPPKDEIVASIAKEFEGFGQ